MEATVAQQLKKAGYATGGVGKWALGNVNKPSEIDNPGHPNNNGFDYWFATRNNAMPSHRNPVSFIRNGEPVGKLDGYACQLDEAILWLEEKRDPQKPFFLNIWFNLGFG